MESVPHKLVTVDGGTGSREVIDGIVGRAERAGIPAVLQTGPVADRRGRPGIAAKLREADTAMPMNACRC